MPVWCSDAISTTSMKYSIFRALFSARRWSILCDEYNFRGCYKIFGITPPPWWFLSEAIFWHWGALYLGLWHRDMWNRLTAFLNEHKSCSCSSTTFRGEFFRSRRISSLHNTLFCIGNPFLLWGSSCRCFGPKRNWKLLSIWLFFRPKVNWI